MWLTLCGLNMVKKEDRICADHFMKSDFSLKPSAYPSLNLYSNNTQEYLMTETIQKKELEIEVVPDIAMDYYSAQEYTMEEEENSSMELDTKSGIEKVTK